MSLAECPQPVTSITVPPARTSGGGGGGLGGVFCTATAHVPAVNESAAAQRRELGINAKRYRKMEFENRYSGDRSGKKRGKNCLRDGIVKVFHLLLHGGGANEAA